MNRKERKARIRAKQIERMEREKGGTGDAEIGTNTTAALRKKAFEMETRICARALKRERAFAALCEKEGIRRRPLVLKNVNPRISPQLMKWRRITSITLRLEPFMDDMERGAGLERLVGWLARAYSQWKKGHFGLRNSDCGLGDEQRSHDGSGAADSNAPGSLPLVAGATHPSLRAGRATHGDSALNGRQGAGDTADGTPALRSNETLGNGESRRNGEAIVLKNSTGRDRMIQAEWDWDVKSWERVRQDGFSVEAICASLGISRWKLTQLIKEHCNLTANELLDGFKLKHLKAFLLERLRTAARQLWGPPGHYAAYKTEGFLNCEGDRAKVLEGTERAEHGVKKSAYFRTKPVDLFNERPEDERARRVGELMKRMRRDFDLESWAVSAGFASAGRLKRALLMVLGKSLQQVEKALATELFDYYRCAEDRELRNLALREKTSTAVFRAREMYHGKEDPPKEPFLDGWSAALFGEKDWVERMMMAFG